jgi:hypothetical protein
MARLNYERPIGEDMMIRYIMLLVVFITGCASGGGGTPYTPLPSVQPTAGVWHGFKDFEEETHVYDLEEVETTVTYGTGVYKTSDQFDRTDKYKIAEYGFFQITADGLHDGQHRNDDEALPSQPWDQIGEVIRADLNGDGWQDFFYVEAWEGSRDAQPNSYLWAFINDGLGQFTPEKMGCIGYGDFDYKSDTSNPCGFVSHWQRPIVGDFNGDGIDDFYKTSILYLSSEDGHKNMSFQLPDFQFTQYHDQPGDLSGAWTHDNYASDVDNDGDLDIFGIYTDESVGWTMMFNDGNGVFTPNHNFNYEPSLWATTAAIGDFNNDGHGDVAVGWFNPIDSAGAVFWNNGNNDWRDSRTELPANYFGTNGNANDMEVVDFNNDGYLDILLASTTHDPYYAGRAIQFFQNMGNGTFTDVLQFEEGSGDGSMQLLDFDHDGDLDIVDVVDGTYVLINNTVGKFVSYEYYNDFPGAGSESTFYPVEIDGKYQYDFIGRHQIYDGDTSINTLYQVLDPPAQMAKDILTKPSGYAQAASENKLRYASLRHAQLDGNNELTITNNDMLGFDIELGSTHLGVGYARSDRKAHNETVYFGTGQATIDMDTYTIYAERLWRTMRFGLAYYSTHVNSFNEFGSNYDVRVDPFVLQDIEVFADIRLPYGFHAGISSYSSIGNNDITFEGLKYKHKDSDIRFRIGYEKRF